MISEAGSFTPAIMDLGNCRCLLGQHYAIFEDTNAIRNLEDTKRRLKRKGRRRGVKDFLVTLDDFRKSFRTIHGIAGNKLLDLEDDYHQDGLVEMAHAYLCVFENGYRHWPQGSNDGTLEYPRDENELYYNIICRFIRKNTLDSGKRLRCKRARDEDGAISYGPPQRRPRQSTDSEIPMPLPVDLYDSSSSESPMPLPDHFDEPSSSESEPSPSSSQESHVPPQHEARPAVIGRTDSPDELTQDYLENQPVAPQQRQLNRIQDEDGNLRRISFGQPPSPPVNLHVRTISIGTQTGDEERRRRDANAPPPSSYDSSQQTRHPLQDNHDNRFNDAEDAPTPASVVEIPRPFNAPPVAEIGLFVSYDVFPGRNVPFYPNGDIFNIFTYSLHRFCQQVNWQSAPDVLLICLEAPGCTHMDLVFKNDEDHFGLVMRRYKQIALRLMADYKRLEMNAVIDITFEPVVKGHTHSMSLDAWYRAGTTV